MTRTGFFRHRVELIGTELSGQEFQMVNFRPHDDTTGFPRPTRLLENHAGVDHSSSE
jgi:hypothetical protein